MVQQWGYALSRKADGSGWTWALAVIPQLCTRWRFTSGQLRKSAEWALACRQGLYRCQSVIFMSIGVFAQELPFGFSAAEGKGESCSDQKCMVYSTSTIAWSVIKILHCCLLITYWLQSSTSMKIFLSLQSYFDYIFHVSSHYFIFPLISALTFTNRWKIQKTRGTWYGH